MSWKTMLVLVGAVAVLAIAAEGIGGVLSLLPIGLVFGWASVVQWEHGPGKGPVPIVVIPGCVVLAVVALFAVSWALDLDGTATGSSTAALGLLFVPVWATALGVATAIGVGLLHPDPRGRRGAEQAHEADEAKVG